ncbi:hypothetical protein HELRODRAFT_167542 [Helobdella robusta]|uniref:BROMI middle region domain-containing protein n=1 Tax=Helobdella robusta TaxID=6412 RepID=T1EZG9_HELRO|nr:hypothetical protein HELRODRAFT_167542 [Helobdella robusta]ESO11023.1 hypothetical protein HELRODRAFT_167542 [Helobdella robusta]
MSDALKHTLSLLAMGNLKSANHTLSHGVKSLLTPIRFISLVDHKALWFTKAMLSRAIRTIIKFALKTKLKLKNSQMLAQREKPNISKNSPISDLPFTYKLNHLDLILVIHDIRLVSSLLRSKLGRQLFPVRILKIKNVKNCNVSLENAVLCLISLFANASKSFPHSPSSSSSSSSSSSLDPCTISYECVKCICTNEDTCQECFCTEKVFRALTGCWLKQNRNAHSDRVRFTSYNCLLIVSQWRILTTLTRGPKFSSGSKGTNPLGILDPPLLIVHNMMNVVEKASDSLYSGRVSNPARATQQLRCMDILCSIASNESGRKFLLNSRMMMDGMKNDDDDDDAAANDDDGVNDEEKKLSGIDSDNGSGRGLISNNNNINNINDNINICCACCKLLQTLHQLCCLNAGVELIKKYNVHLVIKNVLNYVSREIENQETATPRAGNNNDGKVEDLPATINQKEALLLVESDLIDNLLRLVTTPTGVVLVQSEGLMEECVNQMLTRYNKKLQNQIKSYQQCILKQNINFFLF